MSKAQKNLSGYVNAYTGEVHPFQFWGMVQGEVPGVDCQAVRHLPGEAMTEQAHEPECNVNNIVARFSKTGDMALLNRAQGMFADISEMPSDYQASLNFVQNVGAAFDALPAKVRAAYANDPQKFMDAVQNDAEGVYRHAETLLTADAPRPAPAPVAPPAASNEVPQKSEEKK